MPQRISMEAARKRRTTMRTWKPNIASSTSFIVGSLSFSTGDDQVFSKLSTSFILSSVFAQADQEFWKNQNYFFSLIPPPLTWFSLKLVKSIGNRALCIKPHSSSELVLLKLIKPFWFSANKMPSHICSQPIICQITLQCTITLKCIAVYIALLYCIALHCIALHCRPGV